MCGIVGLCNWKHHVEQNIEKMNERMFHRGPDAGGVWTNEDKSVAFGHRRLSIVDLSSNGAQPMTSHNGRYTLCYNGEVYNYKQIAKKLLEEGKVESFKGSSDTEVLLEGFSHDGIQETIAQCKGMFAIALYDKVEKKLSLLRDRVGEKPLYYGFVNGSFVFASDIGSIAALDGFNNPINTKVLSIYFVHGYIPAPYSIYEGIYKLEPGTILEMQAPFQDFDIKPYWSIKEVAKRGEENRFQGSEEEATDKLEVLLKDAIAGQMVADVPVGAFLSSGIDSTTIVALMQSLSEKQVRTFTIGVEDEVYNEANTAKEIAAHLGTQHTEMYITDADAKAVIPKLSTIFAEPFADSSQIPTYLVSKLTRQHVTVSLSGDAGDELFCGYGSYQSIDRIWGKMANVPYPIRKVSSELLLHSPFLRSEKSQTKSLLLGAKGEGHLYQLSSEREPLSKKIALDQSVIPFKYNEYPKGFLQGTKENIMLMDMLMYHPDDILVKVDRAGMAVSLESRIPLLDKDVVEFAWTLPMKYKYKDGVSKKIMRNILYRHVPKELMERPKRGFSIPISKWLKEPDLRFWAETLIDRNTLQQQGILNPDIVHKMWDDFIEKNIWRTQIWYVLMFQEWMCGRKIL